jgi:L-cysteine S-thiosulfotransferase
MHTSKLVLGAVAAVAAIAIIGAPQLRAEEPSPERVQEVIDAAFANAPDEFRPRLEPDEVMQICNASRNNPDDEGWDRIIELATESIVYPDDGNLMGDWENGEQLAQSGYGMRFTDYPPARETGGNCYACHQLTEAEVSYGTIGPSLRQYGELRDYTEEAVRAAYDKIYNPHAALPCSMMPRFGTNEVLTPEQIRDIVALLMDPESPVNK